MAREILAKWLIDNFAGHHPSPPHESLIALAHETQALVKAAFMKQKPLRPSKVREQLKSLKLHCTKAAQSLQEAGDRGMMFIVTAANANRPPDFEVLHHVAYLERMAHLADRALLIASEYGVSLEDGKGGIQADERLRSLVFMLADRYRELLAIKPTYTINLESGIAENDFINFVHEAIRLFCLKEERPGIFAIDAAIRRALCKDETMPLEHDPPPLISSLSKNT